METRTTFKLVAVSGMILASTAGAFAAPATTPTTEAGWTPPPGSVITTTTTADTPPPSAVSTTRATPEGTAAGSPAQYTTVPAAPVNVDVTQTKPTSFSLQGSVTRQALPTASLTATIEREIKRPSPGPPSRFVALTLHLNNPGDESLILDGNNATAYYSSGAPAKNATEVQAVDDASHMLTKKQKYAVALVTLGTATLAGPLFYEWILGGASNPKLSMGEDEIRRRVEGVRLGERVMLPTEKADGTVFLPAEQGIPTSIIVPVFTYPARIPAGALRVDIR